MSDPVLDALAEAADRRMPARPTPPVSDIYARARRRATSGRRRQVLLPAGAVAAVVMIVVGAQQLGDVHGQPPPLAIPTPPILGVLAPPQAVGARMGAEYGHLTGEPVSQADVLAVSPPDEQGRTVRTYGQLEPRTRTDAQGRPTAYRCVLTHPEAGPAGTPAGLCQNVTLLMPEPRTTVAARVEGLPEATFIAGTAPPGTAAVRLEAPGREPVTVGTAVAGPKWADAVYFTAWWPRAATTVTAYDSERRELGQLRLPDPTPRRTGPDDPELGVLMLSADDLPLLQRPRSAPLQGLVSADVLARLEVAPHVIKYTVGVLRNGERCTFTFVQDHSGVGDGRHGGGGGCGRADDDVAQPPIQVSRSFSAAQGAQPEQHSIQGSAPAGTAEVILSSEGSAGQRVPVYSGGSRWQDRTYFAADLASGAPTSVRALAEDGRTLATFADKGMNLKELEPEYLEAYARCLEREGVMVIRHPQASGSGTAYEYRLGDLPADEADRVETTCTAAADAATS